VIARGLLCALVLGACCALAQTGAEQAGDKNETTDTPPLTAEQLQQLRVECTAPSQAATLVGTHACVAGRVYRVTTTRHGAIHLSLCPAHSKCSFHVMTLPRDRGKLDDLAFLQGKIVAVVGNVRLYRGRPAIELRQREQLQVAADDAIEYDASAPRPVRGKNNPTPIPLPGLTHQRAW
jgi:hypothetical protein